MNGSASSSRRRDVECVAGESLFHATERGFGPGFEPLIRGMGRPHPYHPQMVGTVTVRPGQRFAIVPKSRRVGLGDLSVAELWLLRKALDALRTSGRLALVRQRLLDRICAALGEQTATPWSGPPDR